MKVTCVIVTYNRKSMLIEVLSSVFGQSYEPDEVVVVNNKSSDGTTEYLNEITDDLSKLHHLCLDQNTGGAGGFHHGIKCAYERGADWIWIMDDDAVPDNNALKKLVESDVFQRHLSSHEDLGFLASRVDWRDGSVCFMNIPNVVRDWHEYHRYSPCCTRISSASFVSILINRKAIETVGYPVKEFFIWFDDVEYTRRITNRFPSYYVADSVVTHITATNMMPADYTQLKRDTLWKFKYGIRNEVAVTANAKYGFLKGLLFILWQFYFMSRTKKGIVKIAALAFPALRGLFFKYKKLIEFPVSKTKRTEHSG